ncbi:MAG: AsnC family transcriptional regulator [Nitrosopumilus sp.]|nr:AsnC family transcriptional regulator [Nitrosopumilus sp.]NNL57940.1 AsnC family transcriptional regulator [Nitrosopumilus sp.]
MAKAYVLIVNDSGFEDSVISNLRNIGSIKSAHGTFGSYDVLAKLESFDEESIQNDLSKGIRKISKIRSTLTLLVDKKPGLSKTSESERQVLDEHMAQAYIAIHCFKSDEDKIMSELNKIPEVIEGDLLVGNYEIICKVAAPSYNEISEIISKKIRKIPEIKSTNTINLINKQGFSR